jgi:ABC-2 type transport system permease protein
LPAWAQAIARMLPSTYVFEALRMVLRGQPLPWTSWLAIVGLNAAACLLGAAFFGLMFRRARSMGRLGRLAQD